MFQPSAERNKHEQHRWRVEKHHGTFAAERHSDNDHGKGIRVGNAGGKGNEHVHIGGPMLQSLESLDEK